jgi:hypothetical protein
MCRVAAIIQPRLAPPLPPKRVHFASPNRRHHLANQRIRSVTGTPLRELEYGKFANVDYRKLPTMEELPISLRQSIKRRYGK